jgi:hypothetical protein
MLTLLPPSRLFIWGNILTAHGELWKALEAHHEASDIRRGFKNQPEKLGISLHKIGTLQYRMGHRKQAMQVPPVFHFPTAPSA